MTLTDLGLYVERYVEALKALGAIRSADVERAFRSVERHRLLEDFYYRDPDLHRFVTIHHDPANPARDALELIYSDKALATRIANDMPLSSTSQPSLMAEMLELLELKGGMKVLEIGAGTGYNAALMAEIVGSQDLVATVDIEEDVVLQTRRLLASAGYPRVSVLRRDGVEGAAESAPFDRITVTVGCSDLSPSWVEQLSKDGSMLVPLAHSQGHPLVLVRKVDTRLHGQIVRWTGFIPAQGPLHIAGFWSQGAIMIDSDQVIHKLDPWPGFGTSGPVESLGGRSADEIDFLFFLGLHDRRACELPQGVGLSNELDGWAVAGPGGVWWWKSAALVDTLAMYHQKWLAKGRPGIGDYQLSFVPVEEAEQPHPEAWQIERRFFHEFVTIDR